MTKYESEHLVCIGEFYLSTGILEICDPSVNDFLCRDFPISALNQSTVVIRNCPSGQYRVHYEIDRRGVPLSLICHPPIISYGDIIEQDGDFSYIGTVIPQISHSICLIDTIVHGDASVCMRELEADAYYDPHALLGIIDSCPYPPKLRTELASYLESCIRSQDNASGLELLKFSGSSGCYWNGYRSSAVPSSHWACDVASRISGALPACNILGGIVARTGSLPSCRAFLLRGRSGMVSALRIFLTDRSGTSLNGSIQPLFAG